MKNSDEIYQYDKKNNIYGIVSEDGIIKTMYKPEEGAEGVLKILKVKGVDEDLIEGFKKFVETEKK
ncbi:MAG: hypothetical protein Kapaf2KO_08010 [Candidatus Kapaibacteriales bacterium]